jgi:enoyl-CoA hydratase/carnithine racemase
MSDVIKIEKVPVENGDGIIALVSINRPNKLNALNHEVSEGLKEMCIWAEADDEVRVVIITGSPPEDALEGKRAKPHAFAAGADISEFVGKNSEEIRTVFKDNAWEAIWNLSKPTIAMVDGYALGGGCEIACSCDIRIASTRADFGTPEIKLGLIPGGGGTQRLAHLIGYGRTMELVMSGENINAEKAHKIGLVNQVCPPSELRSTTLGLAQSIAEKSRHTLKVAKQVIRAALDNGISDGIAIEAEAFANLFDSQDKEIGVKAFLAREKPQWKHR